jgi:hypothetical protein
VTGCSEDVVSLKDADVQMASLTDLERWFIIEIPERTQFIREFSNRLESFPNTDCRCLRLTTIGDEQRLHPMVTSAIHFGDLTEMLSAPQKCLQSWQHKQSLFDAGNGFERNESFRTMTQNTYISLLAFSIPIYRQISHCLNHI